MKEETENTKKEKPSSEDPSEEIPSTSKKRKSVGRILFRGLMYSVFFIFFFIASAGLILEYYFPADEVREIVEEQVTQKLQLPLRIQKLGFSLLSGMQLDNVTLGSSSNPVAHVKQVVLDYDLTQLLLGKLVINQILIDHPQLTAISKNGVWNFQPLLELGNTSSADKNQASSGFPLAEVDIKEVMIRQASARLDQDGKLNGHIDGLSLEARGKVNVEAFDLKLKILMESGTAPNISFQSAGDGSFQSNVFSDLEISASDLQRLYIAGEFGLQNTQTQMVTTPLPDVAVEMDADVSLKPETLNLKKLWLSLGKNNRIQVSGSAANFSQDPSFNLMIDHASFQLEDLLDWGKQWIPPISGQGLLKAETVKIKGQLNELALKSLNVSGGTLATKNLWVNHPDQKIRFEDMNTNLELKEVTLENSQLKKASLNINMNLKKGLAQKAEIKNWSQSLSLTAKGKDDVVWKFDTSMKSLHYDHPESKEIYLPVHAKGSGHLKKNDLNNLKLSYSLGTLASGAMTGTVKNFGKDSVGLKQNLNLNLKELASQLPKKFTAGLENNIKGTARAQTSIAGKLSESFLPVELKIQSNLEMAGLTAHLKQPSIKINELNTRVSFPLEFHTDKGISISHLNLHTELKNAEALGEWKTSEFKLDTKFTMKGFHNLKPQFGTLPIQLDTRIALASLSGPTLSLADLKSETKLKADILPDDVRNSRVEGGLSFENLSALEMLKIGGWFSQFSMDVHDKSLTRVRLSQKTKIEKPSFQHEDISVSLASVNLQTLSRQNLKEGNVNLDTFLLKIPDMVNARSKATLKEWGKDFEIDGKMENLQLASLWGLLPDKFKAGQEHLKTGGSLDANLKVKGNLPSNENTDPLLTQLFAATNSATSLEVFLNNGFLDNQKVRAESLNLKSKLAFKNGTGDLSGNFSGKLEGLKGISLNPEFEFRYALDNLNNLRVKQHQLKLIDKGITHSLAGHINGLKPFIEGRRSLHVKELLNKLNIKLLTTNTLDITQAITASSEELFGDLKTQGTITSKTTFQQTAGKTLNLNGSVGFDKFSLRLPSGIALNNLSGTFPYTKTLALDPEQMKDKSIGFSPAQKKFFTPLRNFSRYKNIIRVDSLEVKGQVLKDIGLDMVFKDNRLMMEKFILDVLGGTVAGNLFLIQNRQGPVIKFSTEFTGVDSSKLLAIKTDENVDSQVDGNLQVELKIQTGSENQPVSLDQLSIEIAITRIGAQTLDRLLLFLDPEESKPAIMDTRAKLKLATPHRVKIVLKNGNMNVEAWLKSDLLGIIKAPELKRVPVAGLKRFNTIHENLQALKSLEQISSYLSARGLQFEEEKMILHY
jgi:hypothetical protein